MTRSIAILTLALTAALSAEQASAWPLIINTNVSSTFAQQNDLDAGGGSNLYQQNELELSPGDCTSALRDGDDLNELIAIIALSQTVESGLGEITGMLHAYDTLRDMGFSAEDADDVVIEAMSVLSFEFQELTILQFNPREYTFTK